MPSPAASFDEIRAVAASLPPIDAESRRIARRALDAIGDGQGATGRLGGLAVWLAGAQRRASPHIAHPRLALFAATHGIARELPAGDPDALSGQVARLVAGDGVLHRMAASVDADLRLYELALDRPSADSRARPAQDEADAARAIAYGMMAVEPGVDILVIAGLGIGAELSAAAIGNALFGGAAEQWSLDHASAVAESVGRHRGAIDPLALLAALGGADIAAMLGAILAARLAGIPVILDGTAAFAACAIGAALRDDVKDHCRGAAPDAGDDTGFCCHLSVLPVLESVMAAPLAGAAALSLLKASSALLA